jgi:hypothetical protein
MPLAAPAGVDIMIVERTRGRVPDGIAALLLRPMPGNGRVETSGELGQARFEAAQGADTLVQGVLAGDIRVFSAARLRPRPTDIVVLASREGVPLLLRRDAPGERTVALAFSPGESDLPLKYAWPVLLSNVLGWADGSRDTFGTAPPPLPESESAIEARVTLPEFSGSHETAWEAFVRSMARNMGLIAAAVALWLLLVEWAVAMRRPDAAV